MAYNDHDIDFGLSGAADDVDDEAVRRRTRSGKLWVQAVSNNSPEQELRAMKFESLTPIDMQFGDEAEAVMEYADTDSAREHSDNGRLFDFHISLARSLPPGATWADYKALCKTEGVEPMPRYAGQP